MGYFSAIYNGKLPHRAKTVYMYLRDRANKEGTCWPGINRIASDLEISRSTVKRALDDLIQNGYIEKELRYRGNGSYSSNLYTILK
ncbi:MAG: helix-turn-helix domain-containing protein [Oscillospiraceae bacterium]